jgi:ABC-type glycerol-3-phosphate transport system substrate-binding protein
MKKNLRFALLLIAALAGLVLTGCSSGAMTTSTPAGTTATTTSTPAGTTAAGQLDEATVRAFADEATTVTMQGLSEHDLAKYTSRANAVFKAALDEATFEASAAAIEQQIGTFESATYKSWEMAEGYIIVHYSAKYSGGTLGVRMVFDDDHLVAGQWFE